MAITESKHIQLYVHPATNMYTEIAGSPIQPPITVYRQFSNVLMTCQQKCPLNEPHMSYLCDTVNVCLGQAVCPTCLTCVTL